LRSNEHRQQRPPRFVKPEPEGEEEGKEAGQESFEREDDGDDGGIVRPTNVRRSRRARRAWVGSRNARCRHSAVVHRPEGGAAGPRGKDRPLASPAWDDEGERAGCAEHLGTAPGRRELINLNLRKSWR
jgi:hypothetical protein